MNKTVKKIISAVLATASVATATANLAFAETTDTVSLTANTATYTGSEITPKIAVYAEDGSVLTEDVDYTMSYENNINVGTATIIVTFIGNYTGTRYVYFEIVAREATDENTTISSISAQTYTGSEITPEPDIVVNDITLVKDTDYTLTYENNKNVGTATVTVTFIGNYSGEMTTTFEITKAALTDSDVKFEEIADQTYTGGAVTPEPTITYGDLTLEKDIDYTVTYENNTAIGTATVNVEFIGNFTGNASTTFEIVATTATADNTTVTGLDDAAYTGSPIEPEITVTIDGTELTKGIDYDVTYSDNTNVGTATATIVFKGSYSGEITKTFEITAKSATADNTVISAIGNAAYTGSPIEPKPTVTVDGNELTEGVDYDITYTNNVDYGEATVTITFKGNYSGEMYTTFNIVGKELTADDVTVSAIESVTYTGKEQAPEPTVTYDGVDFVKDVDYVLTYENNINAGTATVSITFTNEYAGTVNVTFEIAPKEATEDTISIDDIPTQKYTGKEITPLPVVRDISLS